MRGNQPIGKQEKEGTQLEQSMKVRQLCSLKKKRKNDMER